MAGTEHLDCRSGPSPPQAFGKVFSGIPPVLVEGGFDLSPWPLVPGPLQSQALPIGGPLLGQSQPSGDLPPCATGSASASVGANHEMAASGKP